MTTPITKLDQPYSNPEAHAIGWEETRRVLETAELSWISTVRADGRPHVTPLVTVWVEDALYFQTGTAEQKFANLRGNPNVVLTTGCNRWEDGIDVVVEGTALHITEDKLLARVAEAYAARWDGRWQLVVRDGHFGKRTAADWSSEVFGVKPAKVFAHAKGDPFGATRHKF